MCTRISYNRRKRKNVNKKKTVTFSGRHKGWGCVHIANVDVRTDRTKRKTITASFSLDPPVRESLPCRLWRSLDVTTAHALCLFGSLQAALCSPWAFGGARFCLNGIETETSGALSFGSIINLLKVCGDTRPLMTVSTFSTFSTSSTTAGFYDLDQFCCTFGIHTKK